MLPHRAAGLETLQQAITAQHIKPKRSSLVQTCQELTLPAKKKQVIKSFLMKRVKEKEPICLRLSNEAFRAVTKRSISVLFRLLDIHCGHFCETSYYQRENVSPSRSRLGRRLPLSPPSNAGCSRQCGGSKGMAAIWTWRVVGAELKDFCQTVSSKHDGEKAPVLIRPLVHKLPIDFHRGWSWAGDQPEFSASTKAKLSHLEAGSAFRDQHSPLTPAANLFPSGGASFFFFWKGGGGEAAAEFQPSQWPHCWWSWLQFPPSISLQSVWVSNLLLKSGRLRPSGNQPPVFICYFWYKLTCQTSQKLHKLLKPALKKQLALHPEPLCCYFISFFAPKPFSEVWVCLNWSV